MMAIQAEEAVGNGVGAAMEVEAFKRLYPLPFYERYLDSSVRPDGRPLGRARPTSVSLGKHRACLSLSFSRTLSHAHSRLLVRGFRNRYYCVCICKEFFVSETLVVQDRKNEGLSFLSTDSCHSL